jgi:hypothetical protein
MRPREDERIIGEGNQITRKEIHPMRGFLGISEGLWDISIGLGLVEMIYHPEPHGGLC